MAEDPVFEFRHSAWSTMVDLDLLGYYRFSSLVDFLPWRAFVLDAALLVVLILVLRMTSAPDWLVPASVLVLAVPPVLELKNRRDFLTKDAFVRQSGLLGRKRLEIPLRTIERVEIEAPRFGHLVNVGDVEIYSPGRLTRISGVASPDESAKAILDFRENALRRHGSATA